MYRTSGVMSKKWCHSVWVVLQFVVYSLCQLHVRVCVCKSNIQVAFMRCFNFIRFLLNHRCGNMKFEYVPVMLPVYNAAEQKLFLSRLFMLEVHTGLCCLNRRPCLSIDNQPSSICRLTNGDPIGTPQRTIRTKRIFFYHYTD